MRDYYKDAIYGLAVGDAIGVPVEFKSRTLLNDNPVFGMEGYGSHMQKPGTWSDDTSMTLATLDSINYCNRINALDMLDRFLMWLTYGKYAIDNLVFDVGRTTSLAIYRYKHGSTVFECGGRESFDNGNGSLMRIIPVCIYLAENNVPHDDACKMVKESSEITHGHEISISACQIYYFIVDAIVNKKGYNLNSCIEEGLKRAKIFLGETFTKYFSHLECDNILAMKREDVRSGGYVVDSLTASLWSLIHSHTFTESILRAVNLGNDTDTTGAITGGIAGLWYGYDSIPTEWIRVLRGKKIIDSTLERTGVKDARI